MVKTYAQSCITGDQSYEDAACSQVQNLLCSKTGDTAGLCSCPILNYFDTTSSTCTSQKMNNNTCASSTECRNDLGLSCIAGECDCQKSSYWSTNMLTCSGFKCKTIQ